MAPHESKSNFNNNNSCDNIIVTLNFEDGLILGTPASSTAELIHGMADSARSTDDQEIGDRIMSWLKLHGICTKSRDREPRDVMRKRIILAWHGKGPKLWIVNPDGSTNGTLPFAAAGHGRKAAKDVLKCEYRDGMSRDEGEKLVAKAIGSSDVDLCVMTRYENPEYIRYST